MQDALMEHVGGDGTGGGASYADWVDVERSKTVNTMYGTMTAVKLSIKGNEYGRKERCWTVRNILAERMGKYSLRGSKLSFFVESSPSRRAVRGIAGAMMGALDTVGIPDCKPEYGKELAIYKDRVGMAPAYFATHRNGEWEIDAAQLAQITDVTPEALMGALRASA